MLSSGIFRSLLLIASTVVLLSADCASIETRYGQLVVLATDLTGAPISDVVAELSPSDPKAATMKLDSRGTRVLYGEYAVHVYAKGFVPARRTIRMFQPEAVVRVQLDVGSVGCPPQHADIGGRINRNGDSGELWVKAIPVQGVGGGESRVTQQGYFVISGLEYSAYVVLAMKGETVLHNQVVRTYPVNSQESRTLTIDLRPKADRP